MFPSPRGGTFNSSIVPYSSPIFLHYLIEVSLTGGTEDGHKILANGRFYLWEQTLAVATVLPSISSGM